MQPPSLEPLHCGRCGAGLPLGVDAYARCVHCGAETKLPEAHLALQRTHRHELENRALARRLYDELGKPPPWILRALGGLAGGASRWIARSALGVVMVSVGFPPLGIGILLAALFVASLPVAQSIHLAYYLGGTVRWDAPLSPFVILPITVALLIVLFGYPLVRWNRELALKDVRIAAHASFGAALPAHPGGPSLCRTCGAPLDVPRGARGVPCAYCRADNLVALPSAWLAQVRAQEHREFTRIDAALDALHEASSKAHEQTFRLFVVGFVALLLSVPAAYLFEALRVPL